MHLFASGGSKGASGARRRSFKMARDSLIRLKMHPKMLDNAPRKSQCGWLQVATETSKASERPTSCNGLKITLTA
eukprot:4774945-Pyramimonas_sp.AAC.1